MITIGRLYVLEKPSSIEGCQERVEVYYDTTRQTVPCLMIEATHVLEELSKSRGR